MRQLALAKTDNYNKRNVDVAMSRRNSGEHPRHLFGVSEGKDHLVNQLILSESAGDEFDGGVGGHQRDEVFRIKAPQGCMAITARHDRDMVDVGIFHHCCNGGSDVACRKFITDVLVPFGDHLCLVHGSKSLWEMLIDRLGSAFS